MTAISLRFGSDGPGVAQARSALARAEWAASAYARYDRESVERIVGAVANAATAAADELAAAAVKLTGAGVVADKVAKNLACSRDLIGPRPVDLISARPSVAGGILVAQPSGIVVSVAPWASPVAAVILDVLCALTARNAVVISPHPAAADVTIAAAGLAEQAASDAGAPGGIVQCIDQPGPEALGELVADRRSAVIVAHGDLEGLALAGHGRGVLVGAGAPGVPVVVDETADLDAAASSIVASASYDNGMLPGSESVLILAESIADEMIERLRAEGVVLLDPADADRVRSVLGDGADPRSSLAGRSATEIASAAGIDAGPGARLLAVGVDHVLSENPWLRAQPALLLAIVRTPHADRAEAAARAVLRLAPSPHAAAIHSSDVEAVARFATAVTALRITVNGGSSTGAGSVAADVSAEQLVTWCQVRMPESARLEPSAVAAAVGWDRPTGPVPAYPLASNARQ